MADQPTSSYLAKALANRQAGGSGVSSPYLAKSLASKPVSSTASTGAKFDLSKLSAKKDTGPLSTLGWLVDILSRPMRAVENIPNQALNEISKLQTQGAPNYDLLGGIGNIVTAPVRGFWSNNPADQPTGSELIEKTTDVIGKASNPAYVDTQDNVNPWAKGIGGFVLDVGLDPLTYIPGAQLAKGGQVIGAGAKALIAGADAAVAGTNLGKTLGAAGRVAARATAAEEAAKATVIAENLAKQRELLDVAVNAPSMRLTPAENPVLSQLLAKGEIPVRSGIKLGGESVTPTSNVIDSLIQKFGKSEGGVTGIDRRTLPRAGAIPTATKATDEAASLMEGAAKATAPVGEQMAAKGVTPSILEALANVGKAAAPVKVPTVAATTEKDFGKWLMQTSRNEATSSDLVTKITSLKTMASGPQKTLLTNELKSLHAEALAAKPVVSTGHVIAGDVAMTKIRDAVGAQAKAEGRFPIIRNDADVEAAVSGQYKNLFEDFKAAHPELAKKFKNADEYWAYLKTQSVGFHTGVGSSKEIDPVLKASNNLYASKILGLPEGGYIEFYRNAVGHKFPSKSEAAAGYASLDRNMAWNFNSERGIKDGIQGSYVIKARPDEVGGVLGYSGLADEFAVLIPKDIAALPGRAVRAGEAKSAQAASYIPDDARTIPRTGGQGPFRSHRLPSQFEFKTLDRDFFPGNSWDEYMAAMKIPPGTLSTKMDELFGPGTFAAGKDYMPQFNILKDMSVRTPDGKWGVDFRYLDELRFSNPEQFDFTLKVLETMQVVTGLRFMTPRAAAEATKFSKSLVENNALLQTLKNPEVVAALGPKATEYLSGIKNADKVVKASQELGKMLTGQTPVDQITKWGTGASDVLAKHVYSHHGVNVPGTNVARMQGESLVKTPLVGEANVAKEAGETLADVPWLANISDKNIEEVIQDLPKWIDNEFANLRGKDWTTGTGVRVNHPVEGIWTGEGVRPYELNQVDQMNIALSLIRRHIDEIDKLNKEYKAIHPGKGARYAGQIRANMIIDPALEKVSLALQWLDTKGASAWMGIGEGRIRLYWHQMIGALNKASFENGTDALKIALFNRETGVPMENIMDAVVAVHANPAISDDAIASILKFTKPNSRADNFLNGTTEGTWRHYTAMPKDGRPVRPNPNNPGFYGVVTPEQLTKDLVATIKASGDDITRTIADNEMMAAQRIITEERDLSLAIMDDIANYALDIDRFGDSVRAAANPVKYSGASGAKNFTSPQAQNAAGKISTDYLPADVIHDAQRNVKMADAQKFTQDIGPAMRDALMKERFKQLGINETKYQTKLAAEIVEMNKLIEDGYNAAGKLVDPMARSIATGEQTMNNMMEGLFTNKLRKFFDITYGTKNVVHQYARGRGALMNGLGSYRMGLGNIIRKHDGMFTRETPIVNQAFRDIASGADNAATAAARADLLPFIKEVFGDPKDLNMPGLWEKAGASLDDIEIYMRKAGLDFPIDRSIAKEQAKFYGGSELKAGLDQWKIWSKNIDDPVQFLAESQYAAAMLHTDRVTAHLFTQVPGAVSKVPKAGYVKLADDLNAFDNPFLANLPKGIHVKAEFVEEIKRIEQTAMANRTFNGPFGKWVNDKYMPMLNIWKRGVTIMRPGHHFRNLLSSESIQFVQEGTQYYMRSGKSAIRVLAAHKAYKDVDWAKMVDEMGDLKMPTGDTHIFTLGDGTKISAEAINEAATKHGIYTNYRAMEDLFTDSAPKGKIVEFLDKATGGGTKVEQVAGGVSEMQAHFSRLHHFNQILMKEAKKMKKGDWDKVVEKAAIKVRKSHPDSIMLASGEAKLRAVIPFYTWFRLVMPVIAQSMAMNPGRFMVIPKASYNMAVAMGVNPQSMQDPFPANKLFPDFVTNQLTGPVANFGGNYFTASPGFAYADILNQFVADPKKGLIGMITPAVKIPGELITGTKWDSGAKINDYSDYVDSSIPFINYASNISGTSATGSVVSLLSGQGLDPQYAVSKGNKTPIDQFVSASNWFTGWGVQNISKQSYTNLAEIQKRNKAAQAEKERQGTARNAF